MEKKTPLYDVHVEEGGKIVPFAGYLLPVQYGTGVIAEHKAVRTAAGLFDVSHMGEVKVTGSGALASLNHLMTNDFTNMRVGRVRYSVMCHENGGAIDDLIVYKFGEESYLVVVNAANREKDFSHIKENLLADTEVEDISDSIAQLALQGPKAPDILAKLVDASTLPTGYYTAVPHVDVDGIDCMVSCTGYTGEGGYELYTAAENGPALWEKLRAAGEEFGLIPCGLGSRDTLRLEAAMPLYGHELTDDISPVQAGLNFAIKLDHDFIGRDALVAEGTPRQVRVVLKLRVVELFVSIKTYISVMKRLVLQLRVLCVHLLARLWLWRISIDPMLKKARSLRLMFVDVVLPQRLFRFHFILVISNPFDLLKEVFCVLRISQC